MERTMTAVEMTGTVDEHRQLQLDGDVPIAGPARVRVPILSAVGDEDSEAAWLYAAACNPAFASLHGAEEDLYDLSDGEPFRDEA
jgi:hypothetical protein